MPLLQSVMWSDRQETQGYNSKLKALSWMTILQYPDPSNVAKV